jgi:site-specific DNA recombinase
MSQKSYNFRAAGYVRVSTMDQVQGKLTVKGSLEEQEQKARDYAEGQGWEYVETYREPGVSGEKFDERAALQRMLADAKAGAFDVVIVRASDRLARDQEVYFRITKILNHYYNIQILNLSNPSQIVEPSAFVGRRNPMLIVQQGFDAMLGAFDQARRTDMLIEGKRRQARAGRFTSPEIFYGYKIDHRFVGGKVDRVPVPDPAEYWVLELLPKLVLEENLSDREIAQRLTALGARPREAEHWNRSCVLLMLKRTFYAGKVSYGVTKTNIDELGKEHTLKNPNPQTIIYADHRYQHPWDWETFQLMQERRQGRANLPARQRVSRSPLAGILVCGYCGRSMTLRIVPDARLKRNYKKLRVEREKPQSYFICGYHNSNPTACQPNIVPARLVMERLSDKLLELSQAEALNHQTFYNAVQLDDTTALRSVVESRIKSVKAEILESIPAKIDRLNRGYLNGRVSEEQYPVLTRLIEEEKDALASQLIELEKELNRVIANSQKVERLKSFMDQLKAYQQFLKQPLDSWSEVQVRQVRVWLATRYEKISVKMIKTPVKSLEINFVIKSF